MPSEIAIPTTRTLLTTVMQTIYTTPVDVDYAIVRNIHASNAGGAGAIANLTMLFDGLKFYDAFPVQNTLDRDTYLILGPGDSIEAVASANNALSLFLTLVEARSGG